jgi:hypothetical protein
VFLLWRPDTCYFETVISKVGWVSSIWLLTFHPQYWVWPGWWVFCDGGCISAHQSFRFCHGMSVWLSFHFWNLNLVVTCNHFTIPNDCFGDVKHVYKLHAWWCGLERLDYWFSMMWNLVTGCEWVSRCPLPSSGDTHTVEIELLELEQVFEAPDCQQRLRRNCFSMGCQYKTGRYCSNMLINWIFLYVIDLLTYQSDHYHVEHNGVWRARETCLECGLLSDRAIHVGFWKRRWKGACQLHPNTRLFCHSPCPG